MTPFRSFACFALALLASAVSAEASPSVYGRWLTDDRAGIVEVKPCGQAVCGTLVRVLDPAAPARDINNPDRELRRRPLVGVKILTGLEASGDRWKNGRAYDPKAGRSYNASIAPGPDGGLDVTGCILFLCRTRHWTRVPEEFRK